MMSKGSIITGCNIRLWSISTWCGYQGHCLSAGLMMHHRHRRRLRIKPVLGERLVFSGVCFTYRGVSCHHILHIKYTSDQNAWECFHRRPAQRKHVPHHTAEYFPETRDIDKMLIWCWAIVADGGPALCQCIVFAGIIMNLTMVQNSACHRFDLRTGRRIGYHTNTSLTTHDNLQLGVIFHKFTNTFLFSNSRISGTVANHGNRRLYFNPLNIGSIYIRYA